MQIKEYEIFKLDFIVKFILNSIGNTKKNYREKEKKKALCTSYLFSNLVFI